MILLRPAFPARFRRRFGLWARALGLALCTCFGFGQPLAAQPAGLSAPSVVLLDMKTGSILFSRGADAALPPANMTKLMTLAVVFRELKRGKLTLDTEFQVSEHAWRTGGAPSGASTMFAALRSRIRVEDLIIGTAVVSGNDAAIVLAEGIAGSEAAFAERMNALATELGLTSARFVNPTGFPHPGQNISARDLAALAAHLIREYPESYKYFSVPDITWSKIRQNNRNPLLGSVGVDGFSTGSTKEGGYGIVLSAEQDGRRLVVVVQGAKSDKERTDDARRLLEWGFRAFGDKLLFTGNNVIAYASVYGGTKGSVALIAKDDLHVLSQQGANERFTARVLYEGPLRAPVAKGTAVGRLRIFRGDQIALEAPLYAGEDVGQGGIVGRAFDAAYEYVGGLVRGAFRKLVSGSA